MTAVIMILRIVSDSGIHDIGTVRRIAVIMVLETVRMAAEIMMLETVRQIAVNMMMGTVSDSVNADARDSHG